MSNALKSLISFYQCFFYFSTGGSYAACPYFKNVQHAKVHVYSLAIIFYLWAKPHYRSGTFQNDMVKNLRNVAVPGTGIPLSIFCYFKASVYIFVLIINPIICLIAAIYSQRLNGESWEKTFEEQLLTPQDWFSYWRLNCRLASFHSYETQCSGYRQEDKWTFLKEGKEKGIPISPFLDIPAIVIKDKNEEGGMGIFFYKNAVVDGDWIIQERLYNSRFISSLLPSSAPLSTMRVITSSTAWLDQKKEGESLECIKVLSTVFRAGRAGANTDHSSILFDVNSKNGLILKGTTNEHWYKLGIKNVYSSQWLSTHDITHHPDHDKKITGSIIPNLDETLKMVRESHNVMLPDVPMVGWDVAFTTKGEVLLEVNLSCNFFRGSFDVPSYITTVNRYFLELDQIRLKSSKKTV